MSGFLFSLKGKGGKAGPKLGGSKPNGKDGNGKISFLLGKSTKQEPENKNVLGQSDSESDEEKITSIESFTGASETKEKKKEIVIRPETLNKTLVKPQMGMWTDRRGHSTNNEAEPDLEGVRTINMPTDQTQNNSEPEETDMEGYKDVPVEEFGAALLKGMGWKQKKGSINKPTSQVDRRKQGLLLGIGAKSVQDNDLAQELLSSKAKFTIPVIRKESKGDTTKK